MTTLLIEEVDGDRFVALSGRALPFRGVNFGTLMRKEVTWYAGSNVGTMQVLGLEEPNTDIEGMWSDRYLAGQVSVGGFPEVVLASDLVAIFKEIAGRGSRLRVQWGPEVRNGIIESFDPTYERQEDVAWSISFAWFGRDDAEVTRAFTPSEPDQEPALSAMNELDEVAADEPSRASRSYLSTVRSQVTSIRGSTTSYINAVKRVALSPNPPLGPLNEVITAARQIGEDVKSLVSNASEPIDESILSERAEDRLLGDLARRNVSRSAVGVRSETGTVARRLEKKVRPRGRTIIEVREGQTLRRLAMEFYGSSDDWSRIALANGLTRSVVEPGTLLVIPDVSDPVQDLC